MTDGKVACRPPIYRDNRADTPRELSTQPEDTLNDSELELEYSQSCSDSDIDLGDDANVPKNRGYRNAEVRNVGRESHRTQNFKTREWKKPPDFVEESFDRHKEPSSSISLPLIIIGAFTAIVLVIAMYSKSRPGNDISRSCSFEKLEKKYQDQSQMLWYSLKTGVENVINKRDESPHVYLFVNYDNYSVDGLINDIAKYSASCFEGEMPLVEMKHEDFTLDQTNDDDYGHVINKYKQQIEKSQVVLIANLNKIPAKAARALHSICDTKSPIASYVMIFLTLTVPSAAEGHVEYVTENELRGLWGETLRPQELDPLITRVTDQVIILK